MKASFLILFYVSCSMSGKPKRHSFAEAQHHAEILTQNTFGQSGIVQHQTQIAYPVEAIHHPEYVQRTSEQVQTPEIGCCIVIEGTTKDSSHTNLLSQNHIPSQTNFPSETNFPLHNNLPTPTNFQTHSPTKLSQQQQTQPQLLLNNKNALIDVFHNVLSQILKEVLTETSFKIMKALENTLNETTEQLHGHGDRLNKQQNNGHWEDKTVSLALRARTEYVKTHP